jgi:hypothetical protein
MYLTLLKRFLYAGLTIVVVSAQLSYAEITPNETESSLNQFLITDNKGTELQLQVRKMPLTKVITDISKKTNTPIHYSVLPKGLVSATCVASSIKKILECLLNHKADLIVRYGRPDKPNGKEQLVEAWILGSRIDGSTVADCNMTTISTNSTSLSFSQDNKKSNDVPDQFIDVRVMAVDGIVNDKALLEQAANDSDEIVKSLAIEKLKALNQSN